MWNRLKDLPKDEVEVLVRLKIKDDVYMYEVCTALFEKGLYSIESSCSYFNDNLATANDGDISWTEIPGYK